MKLTFKVRVISTPPPLLVLESDMFVLPPLGPETTKVCNRCRALGDGRRFPSLSVVTLPASVRG